MADIIQMNRHHPTAADSTTPEKGPANVSVRAGRKAQSSGFASSNLMDDFRRLGVQPQECRLTVIRRAAARQAKAFADKQLTAPTDRADKELTQVATSAYRLMDPRMRVNSHQRAFVGRILPNALTWASRTQFAVGDENGQLSSPIDMGVDAGVNDDDAPYIDLSTTTPPLATGIELGSSLTQSLDSDDLVNRSHFKRFWLWLQTRVRRPAIALSAVAVLLLFSFGLKSVASWFVDNPTLPTAVVAAVDQAPSVLTNAETTVGPQDKSNDLTLETIESEVIDLEPPEVTVIESLEANPVESPVTVDLEPPVMEPEPPIAVTKPPMLVDAEILKPDLPTIVEAIDDAPAAEDSTADEQAIEKQEVDDQAMEQAAAISDSPTQQIPFLDDPFDSPEVDVTEMDATESVATPNVSPSDTQLDTPSDMLDESAKAPLQTPPVVVSIPSKETVASLRTRLIDLVPQLKGQISIDDVPAITQQLTEIRKALKPGDDEYWTAGLLLGEVAWLTRRRDQVVEPLQPLVDQYDANLGELLAVTYQSQLSFDETVDVHESRFRAGIRLIDELILNEKVSLARDVAKSVAVSTEFLQNENATETLKQFDDVIAQLQRQQATINKLADFSADDVSDDDDADDSVTPIEAGIMGRYQCLILRDWKAGLPWLAKGSDARLATLATGELELDEIKSEQASQTPDSTTVQQWQKDAEQVAERWIAASKRVEGRLAESMQLHAVEILRVAQANSTGLSKLELERSIEAVESELPFYCFPESVTQVAKPTTKLEGNVEPTEKSSGFNGRLRVNGNDIGVQVKYEPPMAITDRVFDQIKKRLQLKSGRLKLHLVGEIELPESTEVLISCQKDVDDLTQIVTVGDQVIRFDDGQSTMHITLAAGKHSIQWELTGEHFPSVFLDVRRASNKQPIRILPAYKASQGDLATILTIQMIPSSK